MAKVLPPAAALAFAVVTPVAWLAGVEAVKRLPLPNDFAIAAFVALAVGTAQAAMLAWARVPRAWLWVAAAVAGTIAGEAIVLRLAFSHPILHLPIAALVTGACHGVAQALVLRAASRAGALAWLPIAAIAWLLGGLVLVGIGTLRTVMPTFTPHEIAAFGAAVGVVEGLALALLPRRVIQ